MRSDARAAAPHAPPAARLRDATGRALVLVVAAGCLAALPAMAGKSPVETALIAACGGTLVALAWWDLERRIIPNRVVYPALVVALALAWAWPGQGPVDAIAGGAVAGAVAAAVALATRGALGAGDVKMLALVGVMVGYPAALGALFATALFGGAAALVLLASGRAGRDGYMPYGPCIALGGLSALIA